MVSRRSAITFCGGFLAATALGWQSYLGNNTRLDDLPSRLAHSAVDIALSLYPEDPCLEMRPYIYAHAVMALDAVGERDKAAELLDSGYRIAVATPFPDFLRAHSISTMMAKLAWAAAYIGEQSTCHRCLEYAEREAPNDNGGHALRRVTRYARNIREREFSYRISAEIVHRSTPRRLLDLLEERLVADDLSGSIRLAAARSGRWEAGEHATAQALLARIIKRPWELVIT